MAGLTSFPCLQQKQCTIVISKVFVRMTARIDESSIVSQHRFIRPRIRLWLPLLMWGSFLGCAALILPQVRAVELIGLIIVLGLMISAMVPVCEITVTKHGLIIHRLILREKFIPWSAVDRVIIFGNLDRTTPYHFEVASIGIYEGLSHLNYLPGLLYGQGWRQTIIVLPDSVENYDVLIKNLSAHCAIFRSHPA